MDIRFVKSLINNPYIEIIALSEPHQKASELYVEVVFKDTKN